MSEIRNDVVVDFSQSDSHGGQIREKKLLVVGFGDDAGSVINLFHAPSSNYFGFQLGVGANNYNGADKIRLTFFSNVAA